MDTIQEYQCEWQCLWNNYFNEYDDYMFCLDKVVKESANLLLKDLYNIEKAFLNVKQQMQSKILFQSQVAWMFDAWASMHHGKKYQWTWTNSSERKFSFFPKNPQKFIREIVKKYFRNMLLWAGSVWWRFFWRLLSKSSA